MINYNYYMIEVIIVMLKTSDAQRRAIAAYDSKFKRINTRIPPELYARMVKTGKSANTVIIEALEFYLSSKPDDCDKGPDK